MALAADHKKAFDKVDHQEARDRDIVHVDTGCRWQEDIFWGMSAVLLLR